MICIPKPPSHKPAAGYRIEQKAYDMAIAVPAEIAGNDELDPRVRLAAVKELRAAIDHQYEIACFLDQQSAASQPTPPATVIVVEDELFFDNNAHAQAQTSPQSFPLPSPKGNPPA